MRLTMMTIKTHIQLIRFFPIFSLIDDIIHRSETPFFRCLIDARGGVIPVQGVESLCWWEGRFVPGAHICERENERMKKEER